MLARGVRVACQGWVGEGSVGKDGHGKDGHGEVKCMRERCMGEEGAARDTEGHAGEDV